MGTCTIPIKGPFPTQSPRPPQNSHRLAPVFAVLSVLGFIDDGSFQDLDRVPDAGWDDAAVIAGGRVQDCVN